MDILNKLPRFLSKAAIRFIRWLDRHGWCPDVLIGDDPNYASVFLSNLGSIRLRSGYHHLTNWGTCSFFCVIGEKKWTPLYDQNGLVAMRETVDLGFTVDERIARPAITIPRASGSSSTCSRTPSCSSAI